MAKHDDNVIDYIMSGVAGHSFNSNENDIKQLRGSALPYCPIRALQSHFKSDKREESYSKGFYTSIGTAIHELIQTYAPMVYPELVVGNWECTTVLKEVKKKNTTIKHTCSFATKKFCTRDELKINCKHGGDKCSIRYKEIDFEYKGLSGHMDKLLKIKGKYYVLDFKTTGDFLFTDTARAIKSGYYPSKKYIEQIETYCALMKILFDIDIYKYSIVYVSRDRAEKKKNAPAHHAFTYKFTEEKFKKQRNKIRKATRANKLVTQWQTINDRESMVEEIYDLRPCATRNDYLNNMHPTFFKEECVNHTDSSCYSKKRMTTKLLKEWSRAQ